MYFSITLICCKQRKPQYFSPEHFSSHKKNDKSMALHQFAQVKTPGTTRDDWSRPYLREGVKGDSCPIWIRDKLEPGSPAPSALYSSTSQMCSLQGWWLHLFPGEPAPMLNHSFSKEIFPNIQPAPLLDHPEAIPPCPLDFLSSCMPETQGTTSCNHWQSFHPLMSSA